MSHVSQCTTVYHSILDLEAAAKRLGGELLRGKKSFKWYNSFVDDSTEWRRMFSDAEADAIAKMPWHILIKLRTNNPAGFEGGTKIYINPISPISLRDKIVPRLYELRDAKKTASFKIAEECLLEPNCLKYYSAP